MSTTLSRFSDEVTQILHHIWRIVLRKQSDALTKGKITVPQFLVLNLLHLKDSLMMKDIATELKVSLPAATGLINRLVKLALVKRVLDARDRRKIYIALSAKGKRVLGQATLKRRQSIESIFAGLSRKERMNYLKILRKILKVIYEKEP